VFRFLLALENGEPAEPAVLVTMVPNWEAGDTIPTGAGTDYRVVGVDLRELHRRRRPHQHRPRARCRARR